MNIYEKLITESRDIEVVATRIGKSSKESITIDGKEFLKSVKIGRWNYITVIEITNYFDDNDVHLVRVKLDNYDSRHIDNYGLLNEKPTYPKMRRSRRKNNENLIVDFTDFIK